MRTARAAAVFALMTFTAALTGCDGDKASTAKDTRPATGAGSTSAASPSPSASPSPTGLSAASKSTCTQVTDSIQATLDRVAKAEKTGPPVGYVSVSTAYNAGATALIALVIATGDSKVKDATNKVSDAMAAMAQGYTSQSSKPDKAAMNAAIDELKAVCAAG